MFAILRDATKLPRELIDLVRSFDEHLLSLDEVKSPREYGVCKLGWICYPDNGTNGHVSD